jgi:hypothetical protein
MTENTNTSADSSVFWWIGGMVLFIFGLMAAWYFYTFDTQYAPGYSGRKFSAIKLGDSEQSVIASLGQPFSSQEVRPSVKWIYSADNQQNFPHSGEGAGTYTTIEFDTNGVVVSIDGMLQTASSSFSFGDGLNYLKLTTAQIEKLIGSRQKEIKKQFGQPVATYEDKSSKFLRYSKSPSSANYNLRIIGVDEKGRVVKIISKIYWD